MKDSITVKIFKLLASRRGAVAGALAEDSKRASWALADQALVSLGNFGVNVVLARHFGATQALAEYGAFWVLMELMFFLNGIQGALLVYPLTLRGAVLSRPELGRMTTQSLALTLFASPLLVACTVFAATVARIPVTVGVWAGVALIAWQLQEATRRALISHLRFRAACVGDAISYLGQVAWVACLSYWGTLDLERTFQAIAATSAVAWMVQVLQLRLRPVLRGNLGAFARECWDVGRWVLFGNLTNLFTGALFNWNFAYWAGLKTLGTYYALVNLIRPVHPIAFAAATLITPNVANAFDTGGIRRAKIVALRFASLGAIVLIPYLAALLVFPRHVLGMFYGWNTPSLQYPHMVQLSAVAVGFVYLGVVSGAFLNGVALSRKSFLGQLVYASSFLLLVMPLSAVFGLQGAIAGWCLAAILQASANIAFASRAGADHRDKEPVDSAPQLGPQRSAQATN